MKHAVILHNRLSSKPSPDEEDVIAQSEVFEQELDLLGFSHERIGVDLDIPSWSKALLQASPQLVVNLVESLNNDGSLIHMVPSLLDGWQLKYTGNPTHALFLTTNKPLSKQWMRANQLPTPGWFRPSETADLLPYQTYIAKPCGEDASVGISDQNVFTGADKEILQHFSKKWGDRFFVEEYIPGREFNMSLLDSHHGPEVMAPAEIEFRNFPSDKPAIVGYEAKWNEDSFEYLNTVRRFSDSPADSELTDRLKHLSLTCWKVFGLRGYARVDFRVDHYGNPFILEINANPCISPDSGFYAACLKSGYNIAEVIKRIVEAV